MPRKPLDIRFTDYPGLRGRVFPSPASGEDGSGQSPGHGSGAQNIQWMFALRRPERSVDRVPCGFLGQRPKPPEGLGYTQSSAKRLCLGYLVFQVLQGQGKFFSDLPYPHQDVFKEIPQILVLGER